MKVNRVVLISCFLAIFMQVILCCVEVSNYFEKQIGDLDVSNLKSTRLIEIYGFSIIFWAILLTVKYFRNGLIANIFAIFWLILLYHSNILIKYFHTILANSSLKMFETLSFSLTIILNSLTVFITIGLFIYQIIIVGQKIYEIICSKQKEL